MEIPLFPSHLAPKPPNEIFIEVLEVNPYPDRSRVRVHIVVTPFQQRPNLLLALYNADRQLVREINVIETMHADMEFTLHLQRGTNPAGDYSLTADLFYETRNPVQDQRTVEFEISDVE